MSKWFRAKPGKAAVYSHPSGSWDPLDNPLNYLPDVIWHTDFDYLEVAFRGTLAVVHPAVAHEGYNQNASFGGRGGSYGTPQPTSWRPAPAEAQHVLYSHNLGYRPHVLVQLDDEIITPGYAVQSDGNGVRFLSVIVTTTQVLLKEYVWTWTGALAGVTRTYQVLGLIKPTPYAPAADLRIEPGAFTAGRGRIDGQRRYLRASVPGEDRFWVADGKTADANDGVVRTITPTGMVRDDADYPYGGGFSSIQARALSIADTAETTGTFTDIGVDQKMVVVDNGHVVIDSDRPMAKFVSSVATSITATFPNPPRDYLVFSAGALFPGSPSGSAWGSAVSRTLTAQEWTDTIQIASVPAGANFVVGQVRGQQTIAPSAIGGVATASVSAPPGGSQNQTVIPSSGFRTIAKTIPEGSWIQANGTLVLEAHYRFRRTVTFRVEDGWLLADLKQSIGTYDTAAYRGTWPERDLSASTQELVFRLLRVQANIVPGLGNQPPYISAENANTFETNAGGPFNWASAWDLEIDFLIGHV